MPRALILSSYVAADRIGGGAQMLALARRGVEPFLVPTAVFGRSPAKGGRRQAVETFSDLVDDAEAEGLFAAELILTGYFARPDQVARAAQAIQSVRADNPRAVVVVDPVLGDAPKGLYVPAEVAEAIRLQLAPLAHWITPNAWELRYLTGSETGDLGQMRLAAASLPMGVLVTSAPVGAGEAGLMLCEGEAAWVYAHPKSPSAPNGTGDLAAGAFAAGLVTGLGPADAAHAAAQAAAALAVGADVEVRRIALEPRP